jgi:ABC-type glycerol-3-phosphate transport system permease component
VAGAFVLGAAYALGGKVMLVVLGLAFTFGLLAFFTPRAVRPYLAYAAMAVALALYLLPLGWVLIASLRPYSEVFTNSLAAPLTTANYAELLNPQDASGRAFPGQLINSLVIAVTSTVLSIGLGTLAAYAFSRFRIKAKNDALFFILSTRMLPPVVVAVPIFLMFRQLNLLNTTTGLILLYTTVNVAFAVWLMKGFTDDVPPEYEEAALLDRYSRLQAFRKTTLPLIVPGMAATGVFCFLTAWNEYAFAQFLTTGEVLTAPPSITGRSGRRQHRVEPHRNTRPDLSGARRRFHLSDAQAPATWRHLRRDQGPIAASPPNAKPKESS